MIEFLTPEREPSGDVVLVQIKVGESYIKSGRFYIGAIATILKRGRGTRSRVRG